MEELASRKVGRTFAFILVAIVSLSAFSPAFASQDKTKSKHAASNTFVFNPRTHHWQAIRNGKVIKSGRASGGRSYCPDIKRSCRTPTGSFHIISKGGAGCRSSRYPLHRGGAEMPYCMFFTKYYAVHGSYDVPNHNASHGCIRVTPSDALWLHRHFIKIGTKVIVKSY